MSNTDGSTTSEPAPKGDGDAIKVFVRVRPPAEADMGVDVERNWCLSVDENRNAVIMKAKPEAKIFLFDNVADISVTQEAVFCTVGKKIIESCVEGYNGTIFAYGQTGSGKTFTMLGPSDDVDNFHHELRGIIPRSFEFLFNLINREIEMHGEKKEFLCKCSFLEIYNEQIFDLLDTTSPCLHLRESIKKGVYVSGLTEQVVTSALEAYQVLRSGWLNRRVASTSMNRESSRSHAVFTLQIESKEKKGALQNVRYSHLNLVDLAGSERQKDTNTVGIRLKEAGSINRSLSTLGNVIMALVTSTSNKSKHVPYRESKLTFLLRDSLGGNAKTQLIACAHPSSKCFGETLSTLQFAKRAKMIKNKAVVNEDSQGSVSHLQAEVRRLKELLAQCHSGAVPTNPSGKSSHTLRTDSQGSVSHLQAEVRRLKELLAQCHSGAIPTNPSDIYTAKPEPNAQSAELNLTWKRNFIHAMYFREKTEQEKMEIREQLAKLDDLCKKKEKFLQSTKMIVKFRESFIAKLEKAAKSGSAGDITNDRTADLLEEVKILRDQLEHNPELKQYAMENQRLKAELRKLRGQEGTCQQVDPQRAEELEKVFRELLAVHRGGDGDKDAPLILSTPQSGENNVSLATVERYKSQVEKLQDEITNLKEKLQTQENASQQALVKAAAELTSYKKAVSELEKVMQARRLQNKIDRESMSDIHVQTIKTITTPTKTCYSLRNRNVLAKLSRESPGFNGSFILDPGEDILPESQPAEMAEQMASALTDEIKSLQDNNNSLVQRVEEHEGEMIKLQQTLSKLENENEQLNEILSTERSEWARKEEELVNRSETIAEELKKANELARISKEESVDLGVMLRSVDKELAELKSKSKENIESRDKDMSVLETKVLQVEMELSKLQQENVKLTEEKTMLQEAFDNAQTTISFHESEIQDLEGLLHSERKELKTVQTELESTYGKLVVEKEKVTQLQSQMQNDGKEQEAVALRLMEDISSLQAQKSNIQNMFDAQSQSLSLLSKELESTRVTISTQEKQLLDNAEAMRGMMGKIQELKDNWNIDKEVIMSLEAEVESKGHEVMTLQQLSDDQKVKIDNLRVQLNELAEQKEQKVSAHNVEVSMLRDELECAMESYEKLQEELNTRQRIVEETQAESDKISEELCKAKTQVLTLTEEMETIRCEFRQRLEEISKPVQPDTDLCELINTQLEEIARYPLEKIAHETQESFERLLEDLEASRTEKNEEINSLKAQLTQALVYKTEADTWMSKFRCVEEELDGLKSSSEHREQELLAQVQKAKSELQSNLQAVCDAKDRMSSLTQENDELQLELAKAQLSVDDLQGDVDRLQCLAAKDHCDKEELQSQLDTMQAEHNRQSKEMAELQERLKTVEDEHARLVGHQNHKQKIQFHLALKEENNNLREQVSRLSSELARFKSHRSYGMESVLRENINPAKRTPGKSGSHQGKHGHSKSHITPSKSTGVKSHITPSKATEVKSHITPSKAVGVKSETPSKPV
ncbi:kinesin-like protein KIF15 [Liolophura sinensis]|uniref:kinesin-like protein KIF15 n=1 Tax=Liolophura sinensis TaxID=3198878 RepID=UPI003158729C